MKTLFLTGARGLIGNAVLRHFVDAGWSVIVGCSGAARGSMDRIAVVAFDLADVTGEALEEAISKSDAVIHCAAQRPYAELAGTSGGARSIYAGNSQGTYDLMEVAARRRVQKFIFMSGVNLYAKPPDLFTEDLPPSPADAYALSKLAGENAAGLFGRTSSTQFFVLRISAPYGAGFTVKAVVPTFVSRALAGQPLQLQGSGLRQQVFTYAADIARACMRAIECENPGTYNIAGAEPVTMQQLAIAVVKAVGGSDVAIEYTGNPDPNEGTRRRVSLERARSLLGWQPAFGIDDGLACMVAEMRNPPRPLLVPLAG
jgi:nucleoside-diphosphate-sugar epimerase